MPPFPVAKVRPVHFSGSHSSRVILDLFEVGTDSAMRHKLTVTTWLLRLQVASLSGKVRFVPAGTNPSCVLVEFQTLASGLKAKHPASKLWFPTAAARVARPKVKPKKSCIFPCGPLDRSKVTEVR
jgi:hypothetical protein